MMKRATLSLFAILLTICFAFAQRSEGSAQAEVSGRAIVGSLPRLTTHSRVEGVVVVAISVDQYGNVVEAIPGAEGTTVDHSAVLSAARSAAMKAHFNRDANAPAVQKGTITYLFSSFNLSETGVSFFKFMGIPVDGKIEDMIAALKGKGFQQGWGDNYLTGLFNGENVRLYISTNHGVVDKICVVYPNCSETNDTRIKYNTLLSRFRRNAKYVSVSPRAEIPAEERIFWKLNENTKYYDAVFFHLRPDVASNEWIQEFKQEYQKRYKKPIEKLSYEEMEEVLFCLPMKISSSVCGVVWITLADAHCIHINYVNLNNRPMGEDL